MPTWSSKLAIGVPQIDAQHQELFERADALLLAMRAGKPEAEIDRLFWFVDDYCTSHFDAEERLMREVGYPELPAHAELHHEFTSEFEGIVERFRASGASPALTLELQQLVAGWLVMHVRATDGKIAAFLRSRPPAEGGGGPEAPRPA